jgi:hypothetical protein
MTLSSNDSPHPQVNHSDYAQINTVRHQYNKDLSNHVQQWYQRKLKDAANNLSDEQYDPHGEYHSQSPQNIITGPVGPVSIIINMSSIVSISRHISCRIIHLTNIQRNISL